MQLQGHTCVRPPFFKSRDASRTHIERLPCDTLDFRGKTAGKHTRGHRSHGGRMSGKAYHVESKAGSLSVVVHAEFCHTRLLRIWHDTFCRLLIRIISIAIPWGSHLHHTECRVSYTVREVLVCSFAAVCQPYTRMKSLRVLKVSVFRRGIWCLLCDKRVLMLTVCYLKDRCPDYLVWRRR